MFYFVDMKYTKETRGPKVSKRILSVFNPLSQLEPNLVGMFIGWSSNECGVFLWFGSPGKKQEVQRCQTYCMNERMSDTGSGEPLVLKESHHDLLFSP
jgi:hypothetical protein